MIDDSLFLEEWLGYPDSLKDICISCFHADGKYHVEDGIAYLLKIQDTNESLLSTGEKTAPYVCWTNRFFGDCMFPLEIHEDDWRDNSSDIKCILEYSRKLLTDLVDEKIISFNYHKNEEGYWNIDRDPIALSQNIDMFCYILCWFSHDEKGMRTCVDRIVTGTYQNIKFVLGHEDIDRLQKMLSISRDDFYVHGMEYWYEPASWLFHESVSDQICGDVSYVFLELIRKIEGIEVPESRSVNKDEILNITKSRYNQLYDSATEYR